MIKCISFFPFLIVKLRIQEISAKLKSGDFTVSERDRSPSPEPSYDSNGVRTNTREIRYRLRLENELHKCVLEAQKKIPDFRPPPEYKKPTKLSDKIYVPVRDFPDINFIGLLIGPRGNTLKKMEAESGAKISIRGKGSVKEGKSRVGGPGHPDENDDLHCLVTADSEEKIKKAVIAIEKVIETVCNIPILILFFLLFLIFMYPSISYLLFSGHFLILTFIHTICLLKLFIVRLHLFRKV